MKFKSSSIWTSSSCTLGFGKRDVVFQKEKRFSLHSIYDQQKMKPNDKMNFQIPHRESSLIEFRRQIQRCQKSKRKLSRKWRPVPFQSKNDYIEESTKKSSEPLRKQKVIQRLTSNQSVKMDQVYDINGNRSKFYESSDKKLRYPFRKSKSMVSLKDQNIKGTKMYVSGGTRTDFSKPQNFNPGPGSYFYNKRDSEQIALLYRNKRKLTTNKFSSAKQFSNQLIISKKQNVNYLIEFQVEEKNKTKKSKLGRVSSAVKSKTQFVFYKAN